MATSKHAMMSLLTQYKAWVSRDNQETGDAQNRCESPKKWRRR